MVTTVMSTETTADTTELHLADDELLRKARAAANGTKFALRFDNGYESAVLILLAVSA